MLYSIVLPVWAGFDEPFHYGYVQTLSTDASIPRLGTTTISQEIRESLRWTPISRLLHDAMPGSTSLETWAQLSEGERQGRLAKLGALRWELGQRASEIKNYEAQQAPLAYALLGRFAGCRGGLRERDAE